MFDLALLVFKDACFAAAAGLGFAYACMPPKKTLAFSALLAAVAHSCRFLLIQSQIFSIAAAPLFASFLIGVLGMLCAKRLKVPAEIIAFPALLPMIPGIYAYKAVLALFSYIKAAGAQQKLAHLISFFDNALATISISLALGTGVSITLLIFYEQSLMITRGARGK